MLTEEEHDAISSRMLNQLERIQAELAAAHGNKPLRRKLEREERLIRLTFAEHLMIEITRFDLFNCKEYKSRGLYEGKHKKIRAYQRIDGVPNKAARTDATKWMAARNIDWNGSAPDLRREVRKALDKGEVLPDGNFGLHIEWTVEIQSVEWLMLGGGVATHFVPGAVRYS